MSTNMYTLYLYIYHSNCVQLYMITTNHNIYG